MGIRAGVYRIKTGLIRAVAGPEKKKTEKKSKKEKTGQTPAPVPTNTNALTATPAPAPVIVMPGMPAPVTLDDDNFHVYMAQQQALQPLSTMPHPPIQMMPMPVFVTTQQHHPFIASQPATPHSPPQPIVALSASQPAKIDDWNTRASECMADLLERLERGDPDEVANGFRFMQDVARERKFTGNTIDGWISSALADYVTRRAQERL
jgi:hypothetical protein